MKVNRILGIAMSASLLAAGSAMAQPVVDGSGATTEYGAPLYVNTTDPTGFGDSNLGVINWANGSEIDAVYGVVDGGVLYLMVAGNLESNFNKIELFFDTTSGGQNQLRGDNPDVDFNGLNRMGDDGSGNGMIFDTAFEADRYITMSGGDIGGGVYALFGNWAEVLTSGGGQGRFLGQGDAGTDGTLSGGDNPDGILMTIDNSNVAGVTNSTATGGDLVDTGIEMAIPLSALGNPAGDIKVVAFINGGGHDFLSNQVAGGVSGAGNLGEPRNVDFTQFANDQLVTVANGVSDCLTLDVQNLISGQKADLTVTNGTPGAKVVTVYGFKAGSTKVNNVAGYCATFGIAGVNKQRVVGGLNRVFDGSGSMTFQQFIPNNAQGKTVLFQSAENGTCPDECVSNLVTQVVQ